ncbi:MAG: chemotaxis protein CheC [Firmicutes bacterium]|jgi:chemotaxis protein CheC|nr:chemotaxis protein CheC [Bacillota bacterium]
MDDSQQLTPQQLDLLRELGNIGAGNATSALSMMLQDRKLEMVVPEVAILSLPETTTLIGGPEAIVAGIYIAVSGDVDGHMAFLIPEGSAKELVGSMLGEESAKFDEMGCSVLEEVGNIVITSYLNAISEMTGLMIMPSVPGLAIDMAGAIWSSILAGAEILDDFITVIKTDFASEGKQIAGHIMLIPGKAGFGKFFKILLGTDRG